MYVPNLPSKNNSIYGFPNLKILTLSPSSLGTSIQEALREEKQRIPCSADWGNIAALIIRIGFWGPLYYSHNKNPHSSIGIYSGPYSNSQLSLKSETPSCCYPALPSAQINSVLNQAQGPGNTTASKRDRNLGNYPNDKSLHPKYENALLFPARTCKRTALNL